MRPPQIALGLLVPLLLAGPSTSSAQTLQVFLNSGVSFPVAPPEFSDFWTTGLSFGGGAGVQLSPLWEVVAAAHWQHHPADEANQIEDLLLSGNGIVTPVAAIDGRDADVLTFMAEMRYHFPAEERAALFPFLSFGIGYFEISTSDATVTPVAQGIGPVEIPGESDSAFGVTIGGGVEVPLGSRFRLLLDSIYTVGFTEEVSPQYFPLRAGIGIR